jgi:hypothetical protein
VNTQGPLSADTTPRTPLPRPGAEVEQVHYARRADHSDPGESPRLTSRAAPTQRSISRGVAADE